MFERLLNWLRSRGEDDDEAPASTLSRSGEFARPVGARPAAARPATTVARPPKAAAPPVRVKTALGGEIADLGPGKNALIRDPGRREASGVHEALSIFDDEAPEAGEEAGIDPYNTGKFDRSRNWDKRFR